MQWAKFVVSFALGWVPDALIALAYAKFVAGGWSEFWVAILALQALYFALWFKRAVWAWFLFWLYNRFPLARTFEKFFADNNLPSPEMWVGDIDDYFDQILGDDTIDAETKIKVAYEKGSLNGLKIAQQASLLLMTLLASKRAIHRYGRYAPERGLKDMGFE